MLLCRLCISIAMLLGFSVFATAQLTLSADCDSGTADLSGITTANPPANTTLTWHSATPVSNANLIANVTALSPGTYYAAFYSAVDDCYSPGTTVEVVPACCLDNPNRSSSRLLLYCFLRCCRRLLQWRWTRCQRSYCQHRYLRSMSGCYQ